MNLNLSEKLKTGLTPQEKIDCYFNVLSKYKYSDYGLGICLALEMEFKYWYNYSGGHIRKLFPELYKLKPIYKLSGNYWFNSTEERIQVLNKLIEEQKKLL